MISLNTQNTNQKTILILPDLKLENWVSMDLYTSKLVENLIKLNLKYQFIIPPEHETCNGIKKNFGKNISQINLANRLYARYFSYPKKICHYNGDIIHILDHSYAHLISNYKKIHTIITVHDLYPFHQISNCKKSLRNQIRAWVLERIMDKCKKAFCLVADSEFTRQEIIRLMYYPAEKIYVVHLGVEEKFFMNIDNEEIEFFKNKLKLPSVPIILHVGSCVVRKNIQALFEVISRLVSYGKKIHLLQVGGKFTNEQRNEINKLNLSDHVTQINYVSDEDLPTIYQLADVFLFPSTYEGFGLPILEAFASGTPVVAANVASLPEVVGSAGLLADPNNYEEFAENVCKILDDAILREKLKNLGSKRAAQFTWLNTAKKTAEVYNNLLSNKNLYNT